MVQLTQGQTYTILRNLGWRIRTEGEGAQVVKLFQRAFAFSHLDDDGIVGPLTSAALCKSYSRLKANEGTASEHFSFKDFQCRCMGRWESCQRIWVKRGLILSLEGYRIHLGGPVSITSGCRCVSHNKAVGGVSHSQHLLGTAADIHSPFTVNKVAGWRLFGGLGYAKSSSQVRHVDVGSVRRWVYTKW